MADSPVSLDFLGEQMLRMQADLRGVRSEQVQLESEQTSMRADLMRLEAKIDSLAAAVDARFDNFGAAMDARFEQANRTTTTNLQVTLHAFSNLEKKIDDLKPPG